MVVDISKHQGDIDFSKMNVDGVMVRCAYSTRKDSRFDENINNACNNGIKCGAYAFATWHYASNASCFENSKRLAIEQSSKVIEFLNGKNITGYVSLDLELESGQTTNLSKQEMTDIANLYMDKLKDAGYNPVLYCSISWLYDRMLPDKIKYPFWIAYYNINGFNSSEFPNSKYGNLMNKVKDRIVMWQYSSKGEGSDFGADSQYIDLNHLYGSFGQASKPIQQPNTHPTQSTSKSNSVYTVKKGDTLSGIAKRYGLSLNSVVNSNPQIKNINLIYVGQKINIPSSNSYSNRSALKVGDRVRVVNGARTYAGGRIAKFVFDKSYFIDELKGDRAVLNKKGICTPVNTKDLVKVN